MSRASGEKWFQEWFDEDYLDLYAHRNAGEAEGFVAILWDYLKPDPPALVADISCGPGRHAAAFAKRGARIIGLDLSRPMLRAARDTLTEYQARTGLVRGDVRHLPLTGGFNLVVSLFTSFGYFESEEENNAAFAELARITAPGGELVIDVVNPVWLRQNFTPDSRRDVPGGTITERRRLEGNRVLKDIRIEKAGRVREARESVRMYTQKELTELAAGQNLSVESWWGDYAGADFTADSPRLILMAKKQVQH